MDELLFGESACPQSLVNGTVNTEYKNWIKDDQLFISWLRSFMSEGILSSIAQYNTTSSVWKALERMFASQSKARLLQHKSQLQMTKER